jgi:hypothetical protein
MVEEEVGLPGTAPLARCSKRPGETRTSHG